MQRGDAVVKWMQHSDAAFSLPPCVSLCVNAILLPHTTPSPFVTCHHAAHIGNFRRPNFLEIS
ncbi:unnamed protein product [Ixodes pacificus]